MIQLKIATAYTALLLDLKNAVHKLLQVEYASQFYCKIIRAIYINEPPVCKPVIIWLNSLQTGQGFEIGLQHIL